MCIIRNAGGLQPPGWMYHSWLCITIPAGFRVRQMEEAAGFMIHLLVPGVFLFKGGKGLQKLVNIFLHRGSN